MSHDTALWDPQVSEDRTTGPEGASGLHRVAATVR